MLQHNSKARSEALLKCIMIKPNDHLPWVENMWQSLLVRNPMPHALLLSGQPGMGKAHFARAFAAYWQCTDRKGSSACGHCRSCHLLSVGNHPDVKVLEGEGVTNTIKVDSVRALVNWTAMSPKIGQYKVVIIRHADKMNIASANALLKTLEDPPGSTLFLLVTAYADTLPLTIRSRCQCLHFPASYSQDTVDWLEVKLDHKQNARTLLRIAEGSPFKALHLAHDDNLKEERQQLFADVHSVVVHQSDPLIVASRWQKHGINHLVNLLISWAIDLMRLRLTGESFTVTNIDVLQEMQSLQAGVDLSRLLLFYDKLLALKCTSLTSVTLNPGLVLEDVMIDLSVLISAKKRVVV